MREILFHIINRLTQGRLTGSKLLVTVVISVIAGLGVVAFEIQTANFVLEKYARSTAILMDLDALSSSDDPRIGPLADSLVEGIENILSEHQADPSLSDTQHRIALAMIMGLPWLVLSIIGIVEGVRRVADWQYGLFGCLALAALLGGTAYMVPTGLHWFYRYVLLPLATYSVLVGLLYMISDD